MQWLRKWCSWKPVIAILGVIVGLAIAGGADLDEITTIEGRLYFLLYASSGLRRKEALSLRPEDVNEETRMIAPNKGVSGTKNTWITFYNDDMAELLDENQRGEGRRWIPIRTDNFKRI